MNLKRRKAKVECKVSFEESSDSVIGKVGSNELLPKDQTFQNEVPFDDSLYHPEEEEKFQNEALNVDQGLGDNGPVIGGKEDNFLYQEIHRISQENNIPEEKLRSDSYGFQRGLEVEGILAVSQMPNGIMFLMKWKNCLKADMVPAIEANLKCPQEVIKFYERRLSWHDCRCGCECGK